MGEWGQLEKDIGIWLAEVSKSGIEYRNSHQAIMGFPPSGFRSDGMLATDDILLAIEIEAGQTHPDTNVGKYWFLYDKHKSYKEIILVHVFTYDFNSYDWRKRLAEFYAKKMKREIPITYLLLDYRRENNYDTVLGRIKDQLRRIIKSRFGEILRT